MTSRVAHITEKYPRAVHRDLYWYHHKVLESLDLCAQLGEPIHNHVGIAGNVGMMSVDVLRYLRDLESVGVVEQAEPAWEMPDSYHATWWKVV